MGHALSSRVFAPSPRKRVVYQARNRHVHQLRLGDGHFISTAYVNAGHPRTLLYAHGNAEDLVSVVALAENTLCEELQANVFAFEYTGYPCSTGPAPSERWLYANIEVAYDLLREMYGVPKSRIVLYGRSLGSAVVAHLASRYGERDEQFAGIILESAVASVFRTKVWTNLTLPGDSFATIDHLRGIRVPTLLVHGEDDTLVPIRHSREIAIAIGDIAEYLPVRGRGHNNVTMDIDGCADRRLLRSIRDFMDRAVATAHERLPQYPDDGA